MFFEQLLYASHAFCLLILCPGQIYNCWILEKRASFGLELIWREPGFHALLIRPVCC